MGRADFYKSGTYNIVCDICGFKYKARQLQKTWDGYWSCPKCYDPRNPQDFVRGVKETAKPDKTRPDNEVFIDTGF